jgi:hypothetical protein
MTEDTGYMLPNALKLDESVEATALEVSLHTPKELHNNGGTWVVSISSGTIAAGIIRGLCSFMRPHPKVIAHMGYSRSAKAARKYMVKMADINSEIAAALTMRIVDEGYNYKDKVDNEWIPFPCNEYYDAKAFTWLSEHIHELEPPVIFWNIGD